MSQANFVKYTTNRLNMFKNTINSSFSLTKKNLSFITLVDNLATLYGFTVTDTRIGPMPKFGYYNSCITFNINTPSSKFVIIIANEDEKYELYFKRETGTECFYEMHDFKQFEKTIVEKFDELLEYDIFAKINFDFREKLGEEHAGKIVNGTEPGIIQLIIDNILLTCKPQIPDFKKSKTRLIEKEINFDVNIKLNEINLLDITLPQGSVINFILHYYTSGSFKFLIKFLKLFSRFNPKIENYNIKGCNTLFEIHINIGENNTLMKINFDGCVTLNSNPLSYIYYIEYVNSPNYIGGSNLLKLIYLITGSNMDEYNMLANVIIKEHGNLNRGERIKREPRIGLAEMARVKTPKVKTPKVKVPKNKKKTHKISKPKVPAFMHTVANHVPTKSQPYPLSFTSLERTIKTFNENHKNVLKRFLNDMTFEEFCTFKNTFNKQVGFSDDQTQLIQMLPNDRDYVVAFFKVYDLI